MKKVILNTAFLIVVFIASTVMSQNTKASVDKTNPKTTTKKVTFYELGSVRCIPCIKMQPVIKSIEEKYKKEVQVVFYDVWTQEGKEAAKKFTFNSIPTQIFVDENGKEFFRHVGYFSEKEIEAALAKKGIKI